MTPEAQDQPANVATPSTEGGSAATICCAPKPKIVCLCGSTRFWETLQEQSLRLTLEGVIVLSVGCATASDEDHGITDEQKTMLDELHKRKIDIADEILVLNCGGYIGESTASEVMYAAALNRPIKLLEPFLLPESRERLDTMLAAKIAREHNRKS